MLQIHKVIVTLLNQLMVEEGIRVLGNVLRTGHLLIHVIQILLARRGKINDVAFMPKLLNSLLRGERLQERTIVMGCMVGNQCCLHCITSCSNRIQDCAIRHIPYRSALLPLIDEYSTRLALSSISVLMVAAMVSMSPTGTTVPLIPSSMTWLIFERFIDIPRF